MAMPASVFTLDHEPPARRLDAWRACISDTFVGLDCEVGAGAPMRGDIASAAGGAFNMSHVRTVAQVVRRTPRLIRRDHAEMMLVSIQLSNRGGVAQDGREAWLDPGEFAFYDSTRPYSLHFEAAFDQLVLQLPRADLRARLGPLGGLTARRFGGRSGPGAALRGFMAGLAPSLAGLGERDAARLGGVALDLITMALAGTGVGDAEPPGRSAPGDVALIRRAMAEIDVRRDDPGFATPALAAALGVSTRRLQEAFAAAGATPMETIWRRRLETAARRLADPAWARATITGVALASGFGDAAQFSRRFRAAYGVTPREARAVSGGS